MSQRQMQVRTQHGEGKEDSMCGVGEQPVGQAKKA